MDFVHRAAEQLLPDLKEAVVLVDEAMLQVLKWSVPNGLNTLFASGSLIVPIEDGITGFNLSLPSSLVFLVSSHISRFEPQIKTSIFNRPFSSVRIVSVLNEQKHVQELEFVNDLAVAFDAYLGFDQGYFALVEEKIRGWVEESARRHNSDLDDDDIEIFVESAPLSFATITHDFFTIPALDSMFPSLTGPPTTPQKSLEAPTSFDAQTRQLAASLITLLDALSVREEFFVLGETSRTLARCIISQSSTDTPRRNPTNPNSIAVLLMDRSLDFSVVAGRGDNLLDTIFRELESYEGLGPLDKKVDVSVYGSTYPYPLSMAHSVELDAMDFLKVVGSLSVKDGLVAVRKRVVDLMDPSKKPKVLGRVSVDQVEGFLKQCSWGKGGGVGKMGALCAAVVEAVKRDSEKELIKSVEKAVVGSVVEVYEGSSAVVPVMDFVATQQCPMEDVLALLTFVVSAMGPDMHIDADIRHRLRNVLLEGLGREQVDERKELWIEEVLDRLEMIADTRSGMKQRGLIDPDTIPPYRTLLRHQLTKAFGAIADENKLLSADSDFQHIPYGGTLGNVLNKFSRLLGGAVPRIREYKRVLVFVVGGVTAQEVRDVREVGREFGVDVVVGGTTVATWKGVQSVLYPGVPGA